MPYVAFVNIGILAIWKPGGVPYTMVHGTPPEMLFPDFVINFPRSLHKDTN